MMGTRGRQPTAVSVVVPARDNHDLTRSCLESVAVACESVAAEVLVVDDGSTIPVREALGDAGIEVEVLRHTSPRGFTGAVNEGIEATRGRLILVLNNDAELEADAIRELLAAFERNPELGVAGSQLYYPDGTPQWSGGRSPTSLWLFALASGLPRKLERIPGYRRWRPVHRSADGVDWVAGAALAMRREVWLQAGPFDESLGAYAQDLDLCMRATQLGWSIQVLPEVRVRHHHGATIAGRQNGGAVPEHPEQLWTSLLAWCHKHSGGPFLLRARLALEVGGRLRLAARALGRPFVPATRRVAHARETSAYRAALRGIAEFVPPPAASSVPRLEHRPDFSGRARGERPQRSIEDQRKAEAARGAS